MNPFDTFRMALEAIRTNKLRSMLTLVGVVAGGDDQEHQACESGEGDQTRLSTQKNKKRKHHLDNVGNHDRHLMDPKRQLMSPVAADMRDRLRFVVEC